MRLVPTALPGVVVVEHEALRDDRGWFMEAFHEARFQAALAAQGLPAAARFVQDNLSCSRAGVLRGLHHQVAPHAQAKLVRVVRGAAWDVAVDLRPGSPTRGRWTAVELSEDNRRQLWIPEGFAHGFLALADDTLCLYKTTAPYDRDCERAVAWNDPTLGIAWPLERVGGTPRLSAKDAAAPRLETGSGEEGGDQAR